MLHSNCAPLRLIALVAAAIFTASCGGGSSPQVVTAITISTTTSSIAVGSNAAFTAVVTDQHGKPISTTLTFASSMPTIAAPAGSSGSNSGSVSALLPGTTQITATANNVTSNAVTLTVTPGFLPTGNLMQGRGGATATVLNNGKVLIAGGQSSDAPLAEAEIYDPSTGTFTATGSLKQARYEHFAALLYNGNVLIAGGFDGTNFLGSAEIYNPSTGTFTSTGTMVTARRLPATGVLYNGKVLIAGGAGPNGPLAAAELYDPVDGTFTTTGSLNFARRLTTATVTRTGVLIAGGVGASGDLTSVELYYPQAGKFLEFGNLQIARDYHVAAALPNGSVLIAGGEAPDGNGGYAALASAELFDPMSLTSVVTGSLDAARLGAVATLLGNGSVLISGGESTGESGRVPLASAETFDPTAGAFTTTGPLEVARAGQTATLLPNGGTLIVGGFSTSASAGSNNTAEIYEPASLTPAGVSQMLVRAIVRPVGSPLAISPSSLLSFTAPQDLGGKIAFGPVNWSTSDATSASITNDFTNPGVALAVSSPTTTQNITVTATVGSLSATNTFTFNPPAFVSAGNMTETRYLHSSTRLLTGDVLLVNGDSSGGVAHPAEIYSADLGSFQATGTPSIQRTFFTATLLANGKVLIAGGTPANVAGLASAELYDPDTNSFSPTGSMSQGRYFHTATLLQNGKVLIAGGQTSDSDFLSSAEIYDPASGTFSPAGALNIARGQATATRLADGRVLIAGGQTTDGSFVAAAEIFDPTAGTFTKTGNLGTPRVSHSATLMPNGSVLIAGGDANQTYASTSAEIFNPVNGTFSPTGSLIVGRSFFSDTLLINGKVLIAGGIALNGATSEAELYDPSTGTFSATTSLTSLRTQHAATRLENGAVLITGGTNSQTAVSSAELY